MVRRFRQWVRLSGSDLTEKSTRHVYRWRVHHSRESPRLSACGRVPAVVQHEQPGHVGELLLGGTFDEAVREAGIGGEIVQLCHRTSPSRLRAVPGRYHSRAVLTGGIVAGSQEADPLRRGADAPSRRQRCRQRIPAAGFAEAGSMGVPRRGLPSAMREAPATRGFAFCLTATQCCLTRSDR